MSIEDIFPSTPLTITEEELIQAKFDDPLIKKYLRLLSLNDTKEFLSLGAIKSTEHNILQAYAIVQGRLEVISALLSIQAPQREVIPTQQTER